IAPESGDHQPGISARHVVRNRITPVFAHEVGTSLCVLPGHRRAPRNRSYPATESRGNDRIANLVISCHTYNQAKADQSLEDFLSDLPQALATVPESRTAPLKH